MKKMILPILLLCFTLVCFGMIHVDNVKMIRELEEEEFQQEKQVTILTSWNCYPS